MTDKIKEFHGISRISFKQKTLIGDVFYTFEYGETVEGDYNVNNDYEQAKTNMWNRIDEEVKKKCNEVLEKTK